MAWSWVRTNEALLEPRRKGLCPPASLPPTPAPTPRELSGKRGEQRCSWQRWSAGEKSNFTQGRERAVGNGQRNTTRTHFLVSSFLQPRGQKGRLKRREGGVGRTERNRATDQDTVMAGKKRRRLE